MKNFFDIERTIRIKLGSILVKLIQPHNRREQMRKFDVKQNNCEIKNCVSTQFLQIQNQSGNWSAGTFGTILQCISCFWFQQCKTLSQFNQILLVFLSCFIEPTVIKRTNQFSSLRFSDFQLLDIIKFLRGATSLDSILKAWKTLETKTFFPYEWFDHPVKMQNTELPPYAAFYSELRSCNPLEAEHNYYVDLLKSGLITGLPKPPPTGVENY